MKFFRRTSNEIELELVGQEIDERSM